MNKRAILVGSIFAIAIFFGSYSVGNIGQNEALVMVEAAIPSSRFLCSASITASSTILALMLTILSFTKETDKRLKKTFYNQIKVIALMDCIAFMAGIVLLMLLNLPLKQTGEPVTNQYTIVYYTLISYTALLGGLMITIVITLYQTTRKVIMIIEPGSDPRHLIQSEDPQQEDQ